jgi:hypothetical protein
MPTAVAVAVIRLVSDVDGHALADGGGFGLALQYHGYEEDMRQGSIQWMPTGDWISLWKGSAAPFPCDSIEISGAPVTDGGQEARG